MNWLFALVDIGYIVIFWPGTTHHAYQNCTWSTKPAGGSLNLEESTSYTDKFDCLRQFIQPGRLEVASRTIDTISGSENMTNMHKLKSFLGICNVYQRFVPDFTYITVLLSKMSGKTKLQCSTKPKLASLLYWTT